MRNMLKQLVVPASLTVAASVACAAESVPAEQIVRLADGAYPNESITKPAGMKTYTVFRPTEETDKFNHNPQIMSFQGKLYATWQATPRDENSHDSKGVLAVSEDGGKSWSTPQVLHPPSQKKGLWRSPGPMWTDGRVLVSTNALRADGYPARTWITEIRTTRNGEDWSEATELLDDFSPDQFHVLPDGRQLMVGQGRVQIDGSDWFAPRIFLNHRPTDRLAEWQEATVKHLRRDGHGALVRNIEPAVFTRRDGALVMLARDFDRSGRILVSLSRDRGVSWSVPVESNIPENVYGNKQCAGNLPDGTPFFLFTPPGSGRGPLMLAVGGDGLTFDRIYEIRKNPPPLAFPGRAKYPGFSYPAAMADEKHLYVIYATGKEHVELSIIDLASIQP